MKKVQSTCNYCALDCNLDFYVEMIALSRLFPPEAIP